MVWTVLIVVFVLPYALVLFAGWWMLYERGYLVSWAAIAGVLLLAGRFMIRRMIHRDADKPPGGLLPSPDWAPSGEAAWKKVNELSQQIRSDRWSIDTPQKWWELVRQVIDTVAHAYHPESDNPHLEVTIPQVAKIVECVARDVGEAAIEQLPGSHILTVNDIRKLADVAGRGFGIYSTGYRLFRLARMGNPTAGLIGELRDQLIRSLIHNEIKPKDWLLDFIVCKAGYYAIELYSGKLVVDESYVTTKSRRDWADSAQQDVALNAEPLRILLMGQVNSGKSSLVNALFGQVKTLVDELPSTRHVMRYVLEREGFQRALIFDTAGYGDAKDTEDAFTQLDDQLFACDLVLIVSSAVVAARQIDRRVLDQLRQRFQLNPHRRLPLIVVVLTHIDQLKPFAEWDPPYNVLQPTNDKARRIAEAAAVVAGELCVSPEQVVPVCLHPDRLYNVEEGLIPALIEWLPAASHAKALRCLGTYRDDIYWQQLWRQTVNAGRLFVKNVVSTVRR